MPELPEVEVERRKLEGWTRRKTILSARTGRSHCLLDVSAPQVSRALKGRRVRRVARRGKHLLAHLDDDGGLYLHMGMTGALRPQPGRHVRLQLRLDSGTNVYFDDPRQFGRIKVGAYDTLFEELLEPLGPDPLEPGLTPTVLFRQMQRTKRAIKIALMDQKLLAGIGNIQASEILWLSRVHPDTPAIDLDKKTVARMHRAMHKSIQKSIEDLEGGAIYLSEGGENRFYVYGREDAPCGRCRRPLIRSVHGGRATFFCPECQTL